MSQSKSKRNQPSRSSQPQSKKSKMTGQRLVVIVLAIVVIMSMILSVMPALLYR